MISIAYQDEFFYVVFVDFSTVNEAKIAFASAFELGSAVVLRHVLTFPTLSPLAF